MKIALIAPPFIAVPPRKYGGTELFLAELATGLQKEGLSVTLYTNGASTVPVEKRWIFKEEDWPIPDAVESSMKGLTHCAWAIKDATRDADVIHVNAAPGLSFAHFVPKPFFYTVHHVFDPVLQEYYQRLPRHVHYVTISNFQRRKMALPQTHTIHHGIDISRYYSKPGNRQQYLVFLGRVAPPKGTHLAIEIARKAGIPLKIAGEIQPIYKGYWESKVKPQVDGKFIEYVGEVGGEEKNELLGNALATVFPIQWDEPFGLVLIESMACGTPVLALPGGSVGEIIREGVSGNVRPTVEELVECARKLNFDPRVVREYAQEYFSVERMVAHYIRLYSEVASQTETEEKQERIVA